MATSKAIRGLSLLMALFFLASTIVTVVLISKQSNDSAAQDALQKQLEAQTAQEACVVADNATSATVVGEPLKLDGPVSELQIIDTKVGAGDTVQSDDCITVNYRLNLADGSIVAGNDTFTSGSPIAFQLSVGGLIEGWIQGLPGMKVGGLRRLVVPAALAYGDRASSSVPANSDLVFDIEVLDTKR